TVDTTYYGYLHYKVVFSSDGTTAVLVVGGAGVSVWRYRVVDGILIKSFFLPGGFPWWGTNNFQAVSADSTLILNWDNLYSLIDGSFVRPGLVQGANNALSNDLSMLAYTVRDIWDDGGGITVASAVNGSTMRELTPTGLGRGSARATVSPDGKLVASHAAG